MKEKKNVIKSSYSNSNQMLTSVDAVAEPTLASEYVFEKFDMVVSMTQKLINDQLTLLLRQGTIQPQLIVYQDYVDGDFVYRMVDNENDIPEDVAYISTTLHPQIKINRTDSTLLFMLNMPSGKFTYWYGNGRNAILKDVEINNWCYGFSVNMDLYAVAGDLEGQGLIVPDLVQDQLTAFTDNMFSVNALFLDFQSTDLLTFDVRETSVGEAGDIVEEQLVSFMQYYFNWLIETGNPYILGYAIDQTSESVIPEGEEVPSTIKPIGTTYTMYKENSNPNKSNLNYCLVTEGGFGEITQSPIPFTSNWFSPDEEIEAKMIISRSNLIEELILEPLYNSLRDSVYDQISGDLSVSKGNTYSEGKTAIENGFSYTISNDDSGKDQYINTFDVSFENYDTGAKIKISNGYIYCYKKVTKDMGVCEAAATVESFVKWSGIIDIKATMGEDNAPRITISQSITTDDQGSSGPTKNDCAKGWEITGDIIGPLLFGPLLDLLFFGDLLDDLLGVSNSGIHSLDDVFTNVSNSIGLTFILPAGQTFYFKTPAIDKDGNFYLQLTYKSDH